MKRNINIEEISDGNLYGVNDLVKVSCDGCRGKASCCHGMGNSIVLDPYDIYRILKNLDVRFEALLGDKIELNLVDGIILPNLKMSGKDEACEFLNQNGRCSIHQSRPGICRIFPLGRIYENRSFKYFHQINECPNTSNTMVRINKWIDTEDYKKYEQFIIDWHYFLNDIEECIKQAKEDAYVKNINMYILNQFYLKGYKEDSDFYEEFYSRLDHGKEISKIK